MASKKGDLERVKGVGSSRAKSIREEFGIEEVKDLAHLSRDELEIVSGIGKKRAKKILKNVRELVEECSHCDSLHYPDETCSKCLQKLKQEVEKLKKRLKDKNIPQGEKERFEDVLSEILSKSDEGDLQAGFESLNRLKKEIKKVESSTTRTQTAKEESSLTEIKGIGGSMANELRDEFDIKQVTELAGLSKKELTQVKGIGDKKAETILENVSEVLEKCDRCGSKTHKGRSCARCTEELKKIVRELKEEIEQLGLEHGIRSILEKKLDEVKTCTKSGEMGEAFELTEELEGDIKKAEELKKLLDRIDTRMDEYSEMIDFSMCNKEIERIEKLLERGRYERAIKRSEKLLDNLENEKKFAQMHKEDLAQVRIDNFCRKISGPKSITGKKIYESGHRTLRDVAKVGAMRIEKETGINREMAEVIVKRIDDLLGREELELKDEIEKELDEIGEEEEGLVDEIFQEGEVFKEKEEERGEEFEEKKESGKGTEEVSEKKPEKKPKKTRSRKKSKKKRKKYGSKEEEITVNKIYWIPAVVIPIIFLILGLFLFVL